MPIRYNTHAPDLQDTYHRWQNSVRIPLSGPDQFGRMDTLPVSYNHVVFPDIDITFQQRYHIAFRNARIAQNTGSEFRPAKDQFKLAWALYLNAYFSSS
jgi:hypothetical protein